MYRCSVTDSGRPIFEGLSANMVNLLEAQRPQGIMNSSVGDSLPCCRDTPGGRRNLKQNDTPAFNYQLVDIIEGDLVVGVF